MAEIQVQEKRGPDMWVWLVGAIVLALLIWAFVSMMRGGDPAPEQWEATPPTADQPAGQTVPPGTFGDPADPGADPAVPGATGVDPGAPGTELGPDPDPGAPGATTPPRL
jgi:hypothetical protein